MKKLMITAAFISGLLVSCTSQRGSSVSFSSEDNGRKGKTSVTVNDENGSISFEVTDDVVFNEDETAIEKFKEDGDLTFRKDGRKLIAETGEDGKIYYSYNKGEKTTELSPVAAKFLASAIKTMISYGVGAKGRAERLYQKGGSSLVLDEVNKLKSDYVKSIYFNYLLSNASLKQADLLTIVKRIGLLVGSDYEKAKLLKENAPVFLSNDETAEAYIQAVKGINSDYEKANALKEVLNRELSAIQFQLAINAASSIGSDYEKANVLKGLLTKNTLSGIEYSAALKAIASINSDYEKSNVLKTAINGNITDGAQFEESLAVINEIGSDYEKAGVLKKVALLDIKTEQQWTSLINTSTTINSDFEKSNVLVDIAKRLPDNENLKAVFMKAAKTISSDVEFAKAVKAVR